MLLEGCNASATIIIEKDHDKVRHGFCSTSAALSVQQQAFPRRYQLDGQKRGRGFFFRYMIFKKPFAPQKQKIPKKPPAERPQDLPSARSSWVGRFLTQAQGTRQRRVFQAPPDMGWTSTEENHRWGPGFHEAWVHLRTVSS